MSKKKIILMVGFSVVIIAGGYFALQKRKVAIDSQSSASNKQESIESIQEAKDDSQQEIDNSQNTTDNNQETTGNSQNTTDNKQNSTEKSQQIVESNNSDSGKIVQRLVSWGFQKSSDRKIDTIIVHSSYDAIGKDPYSVSGIIEEYRQAQVSAHYLIARDGAVYQLVADQNIAWHAGVAKMPDGRTDVNSFSIGIEIINTKDEKFTSAQYDVLNRLIGDLKKKYPIKNILGHSDVAPQRKTDPWNIEWKKVVK